MSLESSKSLRVGLTDQGRFGSSVSNVKDLDGDGIDGTIFTSMLNLKKALNHRLKHFEILYLK